MVFDSFLAVNTMKKILIFSLLLGTSLLSNCTIKVKCELKVEKPVQANTFPNIAVVTVDSTRKWGKPVTAFAIEYPAGYQVEYFPEQRYYLRLRKYSRQMLVQEISIGTFYNMHTQKEALQSLHEFDSIFKANNQYLTYRSSFIGTRKIGAEEYCQMQALLNLDKLNDPRFSGNYSANVVMVFPPNENLQGATVTFTKGIHEKSEPQHLGEEELSIWKTFRFLK